MVCLTLHAREGVKKHNIHIKLKSYKFELLGELVIMGSIPITFSLRHTFMSPCFIFGPCFVHEDSVVFPTFVFFFSYK